jgi:hypothetical protein
LGRNVHLVDVSQLIAKKAQTQGKSETRTPSEPAEPDPSDTAESVQGDRGHQEGEPQVDPLVRAKARVIGTLEPLLDDDDPVVRSLAEELIQKLKPREEE